MTRILSKTLRDTGPGQGREPWGKVLSPPSVMKAAQKTDTHTPPGRARGASCHSPFDAARLSLVLRPEPTNILDPKHNSRAGPGSSRQSGSSRDSSLLAHAHSQLRRTLALRIAARPGGSTATRVTPGPGGLRCKWGMAGSGPRRGTLTERPKHQYLPSAHT